MLTSYLKPLDHLAARVITWLGRAALLMGGVRVARPLFMLAHKLNSHHVATLRYLAWSLMQTGHDRNAIQAYRELLRFCPDFVDGRIELGFTFNRLRHYPEAAEQFQIALDNSPRNPIAQKALAATLLELHHFAEAVPLCEDLLTRDRNDFTAWNMLARAFSGCGEWPKAVAAYGNAQALQSDPLIAAEHASALMELNRLSDAEAALEAASAAYPGNMALRTQLAHVVAEQRRYADADALLQGVLRQDPGNRRARNVLAIVLADQGRTADGMTVARQLVADCPEDAEAQGALGWVALKAGRSGDALAAFEAALRVEPGRSLFVAGRALALRRLGKHSEAEAETKAIIERDPSFFDRHKEWAELAPPC